MRLWFIHIQNTKTQWHRTEIDANTHKHAKRHAHCSFRIRLESSILARIASIPQNQKKKRPKTESVRKNSMQNQFGTTDVCQHIKCTSVGRRKNRLPIHSTCLSLHFICLLSTRTVIVCVRLYTLNRSARMWCRVRIWFVMRPTTTQTKRNSPNKLVNVAIAFVLSSILCFVISIICFCSLLQATATNVRVAHDTTMTLQCEDISLVIVDDDDNV